MSSITSTKLLEYIKNGTSPYQVVQISMEQLKENGFTELEMGKVWDLKKGGSYYVAPFGTSVFAFTVGSNWEKTQGLRLTSAHTDHPGFRVKPNGEMKSGKYLKLNTEVYGGPILNTWLDRPLSLAGRVAIRSNDPFHPNMKFVDIKKPILTIPNLAIHVNREVNKGVELNKQIDTLPLLGMITGSLDEKDYFVSYLAEYIGVKKEEILEYDMYIYNIEDGGVLGLYEEFIQAPRLDNLTSCVACLKGIIEGKRENGINIACLYDNEEIGSRTKQGADSMILNLIIDKIYKGLGVENSDGLTEALTDSMLLSVDVAHAVHPNKPERYDPVNQAFLNEGIVFKIDSNQRYTYDTEAVGILQQICEVSEVKYQKFVNRSDASGGGTLGPIMSSWLPMKTVDIGIPLLAMHSAREMMGAKDQEYMEKLLVAFYSL